MAEGLSDLSYTCILESYSRSSTRGGPRDKVLSKFIANLLRRETYFLLPCRIVPSK